MIAEADPASIPLEDREDLQVKPDPDAMQDGHANGVQLRVSIPFCDLHQRTSCIAKLVVRLEALQMLCCFLIQPKLLAWSSVFTAEPDPVLIMSWVEISA